MSKKTCDNYQRQARLFAKCVEHTAVCGSCGGRVRTELAKWTEQGAAALWVCKDCGRSGISAAGDAKFMNAAEQATEQVFGPSAYRSTHGIH